MLFEHGQFVPEEGEAADSQESFLRVFRAEDPINGRFFVKNVVREGQKQGPALFQVIFGTKNGKGDGVYRLRSLRMDSLTGEMILGDYDPVRFAFGNSLRCPPTRNIRPKERLAFACWLVSEGLVEGKEIFPWLSAAGLGDKEIGEFGRSMVARSIVSPEEVRSWILRPDSSLGDIESLPGLNILPSQNKSAKKGEFEHTLTAMV